jgi:hypothetical protein
MASFRKVKQHWYYRFIDGDGKQRDFKGCPDRRQTETMAAAPEAEAANILNGFIDPKARGYRDHEGRAYRETPEHSAWRVGWAARRGIYDPRVAR